MTTTRAPEHDPSTHTPAGVCGICHHVVTLHWRNPSCSECRCSRDPICMDCGQLASKHG